MFDKDLQQDLENRKMANPMAQSLVITIPKKGNPQLCQNYRTISLFSHPSKVKWRFILNRFQSQAEGIIAGEQAPQNRSLTSKFCVKSTFNSSRICSMSLEISVKGRMSSVPRHVKSLYVVNMSITYMLKNVI